MKDWKGQSPECQQERCVYQELQAHCTVTKGGSRHLVRVSHKGDNKDQQKQSYCTDLIHPPKVSYISKQIGTKFW